MGETHGRVRFNLGCVQSENYLMAVREELDVWLSSLEGDKHSTGASSQVVVQHEAQWLYLGTGERGQGPDLSLEAH